MFSGGIERDYYHEMSSQEFAYKVENTLIKCLEVKFNFCSKFLKKIFYYLIIKGLFSVPLISHSFILKNVP